MDDFSYVPLGDRARTILVDIDGTIFKQLHRWPSVYVVLPEDLLPGVAEKFLRWHLWGDRIILMTARAEAYREITEGQLRTANLHWDLLLMGLPSGVRILINDMKPEEQGETTAIAINLIRDEGMEGIDL